MVISKGISLKNEYKIHFNLKEDSDDNNTGLKTY